MSVPRHQRLRRLLPWTVSAGALAYVFGWATDWSALVEATRNANLPVYVLVTFADKMLFFLGWTALQVIALRRLVGPLSIRALISLRGGSELLRAVSNPLADATFLLGLIHLTRGRPGVVLLAASIPALVHTVVLLLQATLALALLEGGPLANRDVTIAVSVGWAVVIGIALAMRSVRSSQWRPVARVRAIFEQLHFREFLPMLGWFVVLAAFDVFVQGLATRAFGAPIDWSALAARIPVLYLAGPTPPQLHFPITFPSAGPWPFPFMA